MCSQAAQNKNIYSSAAFNHLANRMLFMKLVFRFKWCTWKLVFWFCAAQELQI